LICDFGASKVEIDELQGIECFEVPTEVVQTSDFGATMNKLVENDKSH